MQLKTCQHLLAQAVDPFVAPMHVQMASQLIKPSDKLPPEDRLLIYRHSITGTQQRVLEMVYPVCLQILGDACFDTLARDFAWGPYSNCHDLNRYGRDFAEMLESQLNRHPALNKLAYLPDLARLEWAWHQSLFTADDALFDLAALQHLIALDAGILIPQLSHSLYTISSPWPVADIWQAHKQAERISYFNMPDDTQYWVVSRNESVTLDTVPAEIYHFLQHCQNGLALSAIADRLGNHAEAVFQQLPAFINRGWLSGFRPSQQES